MSQPAKWAQLQMHKSAAKVLMRTEYTAQNPITRISFDLVQFLTLILWSMQIWLCATTADLLTPKQTNWQREFIFYSAIVNF